MHSHPQPAFGLAWCNDHADSSNVQRPWGLDPRVDDSVSFLEEVASGKERQRES